MWAVTYCVLNIIFKSEHISEHHEVLMVHNFGAARAEPCQGSSSGETG